MSFLRKQESKKVRSGHNRSEVRSQKSEGETHNKNCHSCGSRNLGKGIRYHASFIVTITFFLLLFASPAIAKQPPPAPLVGSETLIKHPHRYDGKTISFTGEAIGDVLVRGDEAWINVNDDAYSRQGKTRHLAGFNKGQSILISADMAGAIQRLGNYTNRGDILRVQGVFHAACPDHGGAMMIHAEDLQIISKGFLLSNPISRRKVSLAFFWLVAVTFVLLLWKWRVGDNRY